jgi:DNA replication initiation complex subunit (GINS family)
MSRNIFQKMSETIKNLKQENKELHDKLEDFLKNFDESVRNDYDVKANKKIIYLEKENLELMQELDKKTLEIKELKSKLYNLQDLNEELLTSITSKSINENYM